MSLEGLELRSLVNDKAELKVTLERVTVDEPGADEVVVRMAAAPINPSDIFGLFGGADMSVAKYSGTKEQPIVTAPIPEAKRGGVAGRIGLSMPVGTEGSGTVVKAGAQAQHLMGKTVGVFGGGMYTQYRKLKAADCLVLPQGVSAIEGAACFANPLTALGMMETMKREGHTALVHTAAASNLGQMLVKACKADGIPLVNIVRKPEQEKLLRDIGASHVLNMTSANFMDELTDALVETGATIAFDALGGGKMAGQLLTAMERAAVKRMKEFNRYGSNTFKQVYIYGGLDTTPTTFTRNFGAAWSMSGWLLTPFMTKIGPEAAEALRQRVAREIKTVFASHFTRTVSFAEMLSKETVDTCVKRATGEKILVSLG